MSRFATKCAICKMPYQGFHICLDLSTPEPRLPEMKRAPRRTGKIQDTSEMAEAQRARWERYREDTFRRDEEIINWYAQGGIGYKDIQRKYGIGQGTTQKILKRGEDEGRLTIRRRSHTLAKGAQ